MGEMADREEELSYLSDFNGPGLRARREMKVNQEQTQLRQLAEPFPPQFVKAPPRGKFGSYVPHGTITERMLTIVGPFDYQVTEVIRGYAPAVIGKKGTAEKPTYPAREDAVVGCLATMKVVIDGQLVTITEVGDVEEAAMNNDGRNLKDASSDAVKRCAMRVGLGLHLWSQGDYFLDRQLDASTQQDETEGAD